MLVSIQENITNVNNLQQIELDKVLNDISTGLYKNPIEELRKIGNKKNMNEYKKKNLPYFVPSIFKTGKRKIIDFDSTELILFDIDELQLKESGINFVSLKKQLQNDDSVYVMFVSPSGKGLKILFKLNKPICDPGYFSKVYTYYGKEFKKKYNVSIDPSCKDVSRACFVSYDPELYLNNNSIFLKVDLIFKEKSNLMLNYSNEKAELVTDNDSKFNGIVNWCENKKGLKYSDGNKYTFLVAIAGACNSFGVDIEYLKKKLVQEYQNKPNTEPVKSRDFEDIVDRVYLTYVRQNNTKKFTSGKMKHAFSDLKIDLEYWYFEKGKLYISREKLLKFLQLNGFGKVYYGKSIIFIRIMDNVIYEYDVNRLKDYVLKYSNELSISGLLETLLKGCNVYFSEIFLSSINTIEPNFKKATKSDAFYYFKNCFVKITKEKITTHNYSELDGLILEKQRVKRDFQFSDVESDYESFIKNIGKNDENRINCLCSGIGFLSHSYKDCSIAKAIVLCDERFGDGSNGRSGKSLYGKAIGKLINLVEEDGRNFSFKSNFAFQKISFDTQILFFNDVSKDFDFSRLFSTITDDMSVEKKNKDSYSIPFEESPKLLVSTNYVIQENDDSTADRIFEIEFSDHYNKSHKPTDEFKKRFFDDWNDEDWNSFYTFMFKCVQFYLKHGLVKTKYINIDLKRIVSKSCEEIIEFMEELDLSLEFNKKELFENFKIKYPDFINLKQNTFTKWITSYTEYKNLILNQRKSGNEFIISFIKSSSNLEER